MMELKANERLFGASRIEKFFSKLASLFHHCAIEEKVALGFTFHCIGNAYRDPSILRVDWVDWVSNPYRVKVLDKAPTKISSEQ